MKNSERVLVTGATGFIGTHLCHTLINRGYSVLGLSRHRANKETKERPEHREFKLFQVDVRHQEELQGIFQEFDFNAVVHLAALIPKNDDRIECFETNVAGTFNVVNMCLKYSVPHLIYASSQEVYGRPRYLPVDESHPEKPESFYGYTKLEGENLCEFFAEKYGLKVIVLRYAGVYGNGKTTGAVHNFFKSAIKNQAPSLSEGGSQTRDFVYVNDVVEGTILALRKVKQISFNVYNIGCGREVKVADMARHVYKAMDSNIKIEEGPTTREDRFYLDIAKAQKELKYHPTSLKESLKQMSVNFTGS